MNVDSDRVSNVECTACYFVSIRQYANKYSVVYAYTTKWPPYPFPVPLFHEQNTTMHRLLRRENNGTPFRNSVHSRAVEQQYSIMNRVVRFQSLANIRTLHVKFHKMMRSKTNVALLCTTYRSTTPYTSRRGNHHCL